MVLVLGEAEAASAPGGERVVAPSEFFRRHLDHLARPGVLHMPQPVLDRIGAGLIGQFVHEALDRQHVAIGTQAT